MLGEINRGWYCSGDYYETKTITVLDRATGHRIGQTCSGACADCHNLHRKHPTPEQFKDEYGFGYPDDAAVYVLLHGIKEWAIYDYETAKRFNEKAEPVICACTPWGKPGNDWRPL